MPAPRRFDVDELLNRPGTYFNPETEIVLVVDDSAAVESELFSDDADDDAAEWVLVSDRYSFVVARRLDSHEGELDGGSGGRTACAALQGARRLAPLATLLKMHPDSGRS